MIKIIGFCLFVCFIFFFIGLSFILWVQHLIDWNIDLEEEDWLVFEDFKSNIKGDDNDNFTI